MPMTTTHALLPVAAALAFAERPVPWKLVLAAAIAAAAPDVDGLFKHFFGIMPTTPYGHRGAAHSLFTAIAAGFVAAFFHKALGVRPLVAGVLVGSAMASHGLLDMMTNSGDPVAYLWPLSSTRLFADWRPIHSSQLNFHNLPQDILARIAVDVRQVVLPMFAAALGVRGVRLFKHGPRERAS